MPCWFVPLQSLRVDSDEASTLLVGLGPHAFDQLELLPIGEGTVLLSPLGYIASSARIKPCYVPRTRNNKLPGGNAFEHIFIGHLTLQVI